MRIALTTLAAVALIASAAPAAASRPARPTVVVKVSHGFDWTAALIGAVAAGGVAAAVAGALQAFRHEEEEDL